MGWPKGKPRKTTTLTVSPENVSVSMPGVESKVPCDIVLGVRHLGSESKFPGLWQLVRIENGTERILIDASTKMSVLNVARLEIGRCI